MNHFLEQSIEYAQQRSYLDDLYRVYPTIPNGIREINPKEWNNVEVAFNEMDNAKLLQALFKFKLFPIKDSYVAFLKKSKNAIERNPQTVNRIAGEIYSLGLDKLYQNCSSPKETNRQMGPRFKKWVETGVLGLRPIPLHEFMNTNDNAILKASDNSLKAFAESHLDYHHNKGLDFVARFNGKYVIGEAKFLTDRGGHQNAQLNDALATISSDANAVKVAILDGVCYIGGKNKMYTTITSERYRDCNIMSALMLRNFLYTL